jgi:hypothetical protein
LAADVWCSSFLALKRPGEPAITEEVLRHLSSDSDEVPGSVREIVTALAADYRFFHWQLAFAQVFAERGGFDVVLGNPPWEMIQLDDREFFAARRPDIAEQPHMAARKRALAALQREDPTLFHEYTSALRRMEGVQHFVHDSGRFPLGSYGRLNTAPLFVELARSIIAPAGRSGLIVPTGIATDAFTQFLFRRLVADESLASLYDFENAAPIFPNVHRSYKFCLLTIAGRGRPVRTSEFVFFARRSEDLSDEDRRFQLTADDFRLLNPNTQTCPIFRTRRDAEITRGIYGRVPVLVAHGRSDGNPWGVTFQLMFMMNTDSYRFRTRSQLEAEAWTLAGNIFYRDKDAYLPLYEGKMFFHFDHRFASYDADGDIRELKTTEKSDILRQAVPRYWVRESEVTEKLSRVKTNWLLTWRDVTNTTNERTMVATVIPRSAVANSAPIALGLRPHAAACLSSFVADFIARAKTGSSHLNFFTVEQLPVLPPVVFGAEAPWEQGISVERWMAPRLAELYCTALDMMPVAEDLGFPSAPFRWNDARRDVLRAELDAAFFHLYGLPRGDVDYVMDTFPIVKGKDERTHGEYRTKRLILERFDALAEAITSRVSYVSVLKPTPAHASLSANKP